MPTCRPGERLHEVRDRVRAAGWDTCVVVNEVGVVLGRLGGRLGRGTGPRRGSDDTPTTYRPDTPVEALRERVRAGRPRDFLITDSDGQLVGLVRGEDLARRQSRRGGRRPARARRVVTRS